LFSQLGISAEDFLKSGSKQESAANSIEQQMTQSAKATGAATGAMTLLTKAFNTGMDTFGKLVLAIVGTIKALNAFSIAAAAKAPGAAAAAGALGKGLQVGSGLAVGITGAQLGKSLVEQGNTKAGMFTGAGLGALGAAIAAAPFTGGASLAALALLGGGLGGA
jgi:hypothetical protein